MAQYYNTIDSETHVWSVTVGGLGAQYVAPGGVNVSWRGEGRGFGGAIFSSELRCVFRCESSDAGYIESIGNGSTTAQQVTVYKDGNLWWVGVMQGEAVKLEVDAGAGYWFEVSAMDALALLKEKDFEADDGSQFTGTATLLEHVALILKKLPTAGTWSGADVFIRTCVGWLAGQHVPDTDPMAYTWVNRRVWYDYDAKGNVKKTTCFDVLKNILEITGSRIWQCEGAWLIEQPFIRDSELFPGWNYDYSLTGTETVLSGTRDISCGSDSDRVAPGGHYDWMPALREAKFTFKARQRRNWLAGYSATDASAVTHRDGDKLVYDTFNTMRFTGKLRVVVTSTGWTGTDTIWVKFQMILRFGSLWLKRDVNLQNGMLTPSNFRWETTPSQAYELTSGLMPSPNLFTSQTLVNLDFTSPPFLGSGSGELYFDFSKVSVRTQNGDDVFDVAVKWELFDVYLELFVNGRPINSVATVEYKATNPTDGFGETTEIESLLADRLDVNDLGALYGNTSTTPTTVWGDWDGAKTLKLGQLWCERMVRFRKKPRKRMYTEFYGGYFSPYLLLEEGDDRWLPVAISYTTASDRINGEWLQIKRDGEFFVLPNPVYTAVDPSHENGFPGLGMPPPGGDGGTGGDIERTTPALLYSLAANYTSAVIAPGAATSMGLLLPTRAGVFVEDDKWVVMDPATGRNMTATVVTTAEEGAVSVDIEGTASDYLPPNSMILYPLTNLTTFAGAPRWSRWFGTVTEDGTLEPPVATHRLPKQHEKILVVVEGITYDMEMGETTYTIDNDNNQVIFSNTRLSGLDAVIRIL